MIVELKNNDVLTGDRLRMLAQVLLAVSCGVRISVSGDTVRLAIDQGDAS